MWNISPRRHINSSEGAGGSEVRHPINANAHWFDVRLAGAGVCAALKTGRTGLPSATSGLLTAEQRTLAAFRFPGIGPETFPTRGRSHVAS